MKKHIFFDMGGTLTESRQVIDDEMTELLEKMRKGERDLVFVSGAGLEQMHHQLKGEFGYYLGLNGNVLEDEYGNIRWRNKLDWMQKLYVFTWINKATEYAAETLGIVPWPVKSAVDLVEDRGAQISYSLIGHHEDKDKKKAFDPDQSKRKLLLKQLPPFGFPGATMEVRIGGTTCLDFFLKGKNKGTNVDALIKREKWVRDHCVYVGTALYPGGNDWDVDGVIETIRTEGPAHTKQIIESMI